MTVDSPCWFCVFIIASVNTPVSRGPTMRDRELTTGCQEEEPNLAAGATGNGDYKEGTLI
jgi:hypothetical protein